ncbi:MAG: hypothetical protein M3P83_10860 [Actinomycetota bacterium]|nr:hypothetical protein [Actinomycetota bacterium]
MTSPPASPGHQPPVATSPEAPTSSRAGEPAVTWTQVVVTLLTALVVFGLAGVLGAVMWARTTTTPTFVVRDGGIGLDAVGFTAAFNAEAGFLLIASALATVVGVVVATLFRRHGVVTVLAVVVGSGWGCWGMYAVGTALGPAPVAEQAATAAPGARLAGPLEVAASGVFFSWPIGALTGALVVLWLAAPSPKPRRGGLSVG